MNNRTIAILSLCASVPLCLYASLSHAAVGWGDSPLVYVSTQGIGTGTLTGRVLGAGGIPIQCASVAVQPVGLGATTGTNGIFAVADIPVGVGYEVRIIAGGYQPFTLSNQTMVGGTNSLGDITLSPLAGTYVLRSVNPAINPGTSEVEVDGHVYRYYRVVNQATGKEQGGVAVQVRPVGGSIVPQECEARPGWAGTMAGVSDAGSGVVRLQIPASEVGSAGQSRQFETLIGGVVGPTFWVTVKPRSYAHTWSQEVRGGVSGLVSIGKQAEVGVEKGHGSRIVRHYPADTQSEHVERQNTLRVEAGVGVSTPVGGKASIGDFTVGATAGAGVGLYGELQHGFGYRFDPDSTSIDAAMLKIYCLYADVLDYSAVMTPVIAYARALVEPWLLDDVWLWSEAGAELGGYARCDATFIPLEAELFDLGFSLDASASAQIGGRIRSRYTAPSNVIETNVGYVGKASASAEIGLGFGTGGVLGSLESNPLRAMMGDLGISAGGGFDVGVEQFLTHRASLGDTQPLEIEFTTRMGGAYSAFAKLPFWNATAQTGEERATWEYVLTQPISSTKEWADANSILSLLGMASQSGGAVMGNDFAEQIGRALLTQRSYAADLRYRHAVELLNVTPFQAGAEGTLIGGLGIVVKYDTSKGRRVPLQSGLIRGGKLYPLSTTGGTHNVPANQDSIYTIQGEWVTQAMPSLAEAWQRAVEIVKEMGETVVAVGKAVLTAGQGSWEPGESITVDSWEELAGGQSAPLMHDSMRLMGEGAIVLEYGVGGIYRFSADTPPTEPVTLELSYQDEQVVGFDEADLRIYRLDEESNQWQLVGGTVDTEVNVVTASITELGVFALAPPMPTGVLSFTLSEQVVPADGTSTVTAEAAALVLNNGEAVADGWLYTVSATGMEIVSEDLDESREGVQVASMDGKVTVEFQAPVTGGVGGFVVRSVYGDAFGEGMIAFSDDAPPAVPTAVVVVPGQSRLYVSWGPSATPEDVAYHRVYYREGAAGPPWDGTALVEGQASPVNVSGQSAVLRGLTLEATYYIAVTAVDGSGNESDHSAVVAATTVESPPYPPFDVRHGEEEDDTQVVSWGLSEDDGFNDRDVEFYEIWRSIPGMGHFQKAGEVPAGVSVFTDMDPVLIEATDVQYAVVAVDTAGLKSAAVGFPSPADFNNDGLVDLEDFAIFEACFSGDGIDHDGSELCQQADFDGDGDVDCDDFAVFVNAWTGPPEDPPAFAPCEPISLTGAVSRRTHGTAGTFDIDLPVGTAADAGVECRAGGPTQVVLTFSGPADGVSVEASAGSVEAVLVDGAQAIVELSGVPDATCLTLTVHRAAGLEGDHEVHILVLAGDVNGDGVVNITDLSTIRNNLFQPLSSSNFLSDVNVDGMINITDLSLTRSNLFTMATCE